MCSAITLARGWWGTGLGAWSLGLMHPVLCAFGGSQLCYTFQFLCQSWLNWPFVFRRLLPWAWLRSWLHRKPWLSCGFQLFEAAVVASFKSGCGSIADETLGAIYSWVALGPGAGPRA